MTKLLDRAVEAARTLPAEMQDEIARVVIQLASSEEQPVVLTGAEREAIERSKAAASRGEFATDEAVRRVWTKRGL